MTLTSPGGVGKTRVATELARGQIGRRADGVWLVDLTAGPADPDPAAELARTLWDSPEQRDRFLAERLGPAYEAVGRSLDEVTPTQFEVEMLVAGDLAGMAPQPVGSKD